MAEDEGFEPSGGRLTHLLFSRQVHFIHSANLPLEPVVGIEPTMTFVASLQN